MAYTARKLITNAYYVSGIVSRQFQEVSGGQILDGLDMLNKILSSMKYDERFIPYFQEYEFPAIAGQEKYFIPNLVLAEILTFNIGTVRYPSLKLTRGEYFGTARADGVTSLPFQWRLEKCLGGTNLYLYFLPAGDYPIKIWGKFSFSDTNLNADMSAITEIYYIQYLEYELALQLCNFYKLELRAQASSVLEQLRQKILDVSPFDLSAVKRSRIAGIPSLTYADVNIGKGWRPPS